MKMASNFGGKFKCRCNQSSLQDIPNVKMYFTSEENSNGILDIEWVEGDEFKLIIDPFQDVDYNIDFKLVKRISSKSSAPCSNSEPFYNCVAQR